MSTATKWLLAILVVFNLFMAALMSLLYGYRVSYKQELASTQNQLQTVREEKDQTITQLQARRDALQEEVTNLHEEKSELRNELENTTSDLQDVEDELTERDGRIKDLRSDVEQLQAERDDLQKKLANKDEQIQDLKQERDQLEERKNTISSQLSEVEADLRQKQVSLAEMQDRFVNTKSNLKETEQLLTKYKKKYGSLGVDETTPAVEGNVRAVNPNRNLVLVNLGKNEGVKQGMRFSVIRGDQYITELEVLESYDTWSAARSISRLQQDKPKVGDVVTTVSPTPQGSDAADTPPVSGSENTEVSPEQASTN